MSRIRSKDTLPELVVRRTVHGMGFRFRLHRRNLPGRPDLVFPGKRKAILVHGCFWHSHRCRRGLVHPKTNAEYWFAKRRAIVDRDKTDLAKLKALGWEVMVVWECWITDERRLRGRLGAFLGGAE